MELGSWVFKAVLFLGTLNVQFCTFFRGSRSKNVQFLCLVRDYFGTFLLKMRQKHSQILKIFACGAVFTPIIVKTTNLSDKLVVKIAPKARKFLEVKTDHFSPTLKKNTAPLHYNFKGSISWSGPNPEVGTDGS